MKILLVEDDDRIALALTEALIDQNYAVDVASDGQSGWDLIEVYDYDLVLLDIMLPKLDGIQFCQKVRQQGYMIPVMMLTARDTSDDKVMGLDAGADDYVIKPFDLKELLARIRALLRRGNLALPPLLEWRGLRLNPATYEVSYHDQPLNLTPKEYSLLELFLRNGERTLNRNMILEHIWASEEPPGAETIKVHLRSLRQKLNAAGAEPDFIETVYGLGYRLKRS
jgi:two-component system, OmpR family, response regulator